MAFGVVHFLSNILKRCAIGVTGSLSVVVGPWDDKRGEEFVRLCLGFARFGSVAADCCVAVDVVRTDLTLFTPFLSCCFFVKIDADSVNGWAKFSGSERTFVGLVFDGMLTAKLMAWWVVETIVVLDIDKAKGT